MSAATVGSSAFAPAERFRHDAFFYGDLDAFVATLGEFVRAGAEAGESVLVATDAAKCAALRDHLGSMDDVSFVDMASVGRNPGRIIPVWRDFVADATRAGRGARGIGEPVWAGRSAEEFVECQHHETMLNLAFDDGPAWSLVCPYDVATLDEGVLQEAMRSHPSVFADGARHPSARYLGTDRLDQQLAGPLTAPDAGVDVTEFSFAGDAFGELRELVLRLARRSGVARDRLEDLALAVHELATNSVRYGGGDGLARIWHTTDSFVVEVTDRGRIEDALVGRTRPELGAEGGRGLWMVHQLCDLAQVRTSVDGTVVRISVDVRRP